MPKPNENTPEERPKDISDNASPKTEMRGQPPSAGELAVLQSFGGKIKGIAEEAISAVIGHGADVKLAGVDCLTGASAVEAIEGGNFLVEGEANLADGIMLPWLVFVREQDAAAFGAAPAQEAEESTALAEVFVATLRDAGSAIVEDINRVLNLLKDGSCELSFSSARLIDPSELVSHAFSEVTEALRITHSLKLANGAATRIVTLLPRQAVQCFTLETFEEAESSELPPAEAEGRFQPGDLTAPTGPEPRTQGGQPSARPAQFVSITQSQKARSHGTIDLLLDVTLRVSVELGRAYLPIREILELGPGSVVELDKLAGEQVDILANDRVIAKGEVVVVDENFGVRVTDILAPAKRLTA
ncbi:MAG: flagellar motor switch protein FliN [Chloroflexota bacterium]